MTTHAGTGTHIIGGGIVGWATAWNLARLGMPVTLIDAGHAEAATLAGAGIITLGSSQNLPDAYIDLATRAIAWYPSMIEALGDQNAGDTGYAQVGALHIAFSDEEADALPEVAERLRSRRTAEAAARADIRIISGPEARGLIPPLSPNVPAAVWYADAARVNGRLLRSALRTASIALGVVEMTGEATLLPTGNRIAVHAPDGSIRDPDHVVVASGAWSTALIAELGRPLAVAPQRGQIGHFQWPDDSTERWPSVETASRFYMLAFPGGRVVSGATRESDTGFDPRLTAGGMREVLENALRIAPGLASCTTIEFRVGLRPFSEDGRPFIGRIPGMDNGWICSGHGPSGLTVGPYSGAIIAELIVNGRAPFDLTPYSLDPDERTS